MPLWRDYTRAIAYKNCTKLAYFVLSSSGINQKKSIKIMAVHIKTTNVVSVRHSKIDRKFYYDFIYCDFNFDDVSGAIENGPFCPNGDEFVWQCRTMCRIVLKFQFITYTAMCMGEVVAVTRGEWKDSFYFPVNTRKIKIRFMTTKNIETLKASTLFAQSLCSGFLKNYSRQWNSNNMKWLFAKLSFFSTVLACMSLTHTSHIIAQRTRNDKRNIDRGEPCHRCPIKSKAFEKIKFQLIQFSLSIKAKHHKYICSVGRSRARQCITHTKNSHHTSLFVCESICCDFQKNKWNGRTMRSI